MLIRFNVKNFLSFDSRENYMSEEFSMIAGEAYGKKDHLYEDANIKVLKFAAIYGANASGKSNLLKAIDFMKKTVVEELPKGYTEKYCKTDEKNREKESYFEIEMKLQDKYYAYGFEMLLSKGRFLSEWLIELNENDEKVIFTRDMIKGEYELGECFEDKSLRTKLNVYAEDIQNDMTALFLSVMNQNKGNLYQQFKEVAVFRNVYWWFRSGLSIEYPSDFVSKDWYVISKIGSLEKACKILEAFGTGITSYEISEIPAEKLDTYLPGEVRENIKREIGRCYYSRASTEIQDNDIFMLRNGTDFFMIEAMGEKLNYSMIKFKHDKKNILFQLEEESDGTIRLLDLLEIILSGEGKTYFLDELDRCLHPSLTYKFVDTFLQIAAEKDIQLVVTTHESRLLDFDLLRRDEIWFVDKRKTGESDIYSLEEYNKRFDQKIDKAYLEGRYGGVPVFSTVFPIKEES